MIDLDVRAQRGASLFFYNVWDNGNVSIIESSITGNISCDVEHLSVFVRGCLGSL